MHVCLDCLTIPSVPMETTGFLFCVVNVFVSFSLTLDVLLCTPQMMFVFVATSTSNVGFAEPGLKGLEAFKRQSEVTDVSG